MTIDVTTINPLAPTNKNMTCRGLDDPAHVMSSSMNHGSSHVQVALHEVLGTDLELWSWPAHYHGSLVSDCFWWSGKAHAGETRVDELGPEDIRRLLFKRKLQFFCFLMRRKVMISLAMAFDRFQVPTLKINSFSEFILKTSGRYTMVKLLQLFYFDFCLKPICVCGNNGTKKASSIEIVGD